MDEQYKKTGLEVSYINKKLTLDNCVKNARSYLLFGEVFIEERNNTWNTPYLFNAKELDEETGNYYFGKRYYDPRTSIWLSTDLLQEKYPNVSTYAYCVQNPVKHIDPDGKDWIVVSQGGDELRRVVDKRPDFYYKVNETAFNMVSSYYQESLGVTDNFNNTLLSIGGLMQIEQNWGVDGLVAKQTDIGIDISGSMREENSLLADVTIKIQASFDDGGAYDIATYTGVAGGFGNGAPENGNYTTNHYRQRGRYRSESGYYKDGVSFSYDLIPTFSTGRTDLRIHPDGNDEGTLGCVGLSGNSTILKDFKNHLNAILNNKASIPTNINIQNNPNNNGYKSKKTSNIYE